MPIKLAESSNQIVCLAIEESTLSDGSKVYAVRVGPKLFECVTQKDAERAFMCFEKGIGVIEGRAMANLKVD